jgi:hypothetical protein
VRTTVREKLLIANPTYLPDDRPAGDPPTDNPPTDNLAP